MHIRECVSNQRNKVGNSKCIGSLPTASIIEVREHNNLFISQLSMFFFVPSSSMLRKVKNQHPLPLYFKMHLNAVLVAHASLPIFHSTFCCRNNVVCTNPNALGSRIRLHAVPFSIHNMHFGSMYRGFSLF